MSNAFCVQVVENDDSRNSAARKSRCVTPRLRAPSAKHKGTFVILGQNLRHALLNTLNPAQLIKPCGVAATETGDTGDNHTASHEKYTVFTRVGKWHIIAMVAYAAWFSTLSSFIHFPAIHSISTSLSVSVDKVNLTITSYLAVATIALSLVGDVADILCRRPAYIATLTLYAVVNIAITLIKSYLALLDLREMQAFAILGMILFQLRNICSFSQVHF